MMLVNPSEIFSFSGLSCSSDDMPVEAAIRLIRDMGNKKKRNDIRQSYIPAM